MNLTRLQVEILLGLVAGERNWLKRSPGYPEDEQHLVELGELREVLRAERKQQREDEGRMDKDIIILQSAATARMIEVQGFEGEKLLWVNEDVQAVTFGLVDPPLTFTWSKLKELLSSRLARSIAEEVSW